jgi:diguanylate cyclase (GGDEF)-like protein/PAS domain S-box-containing protein
MYWKNLDELIEHTRRSESSELNECCQQWHVIFDTEGNFKYLSDYYFQSTNFTAENVLGKHFLQFVRDDISADEQALFLELFKKKQSIKHFSFRRTRLDGTSLFVSSSGVPQFDHSGAFIGYLGISQDLSELVDDAISKGAISVFDDCPLGVTLNQYYTEDDGVVTSRRRYANRTMAEKIGVSPKEFIDLPISMSWKDESHLQSINSRLNSGRQLQAEEVVRINADQKPLWLEMTSQKFFVSGQSYTLTWHNDVTKRKIQSEELRKANIQLAELSTTDGLTGLKNRREFDRSLNIEWDRACRSGKTLGLIMIDVDFFKLYNDEYGHPAGDSCLKAVSGQLAEYTRRASDFAARYGGEEFAVLCSLTSEPQLTDLAENIRTAISKLNIPHSRSDFGRVTVSVGSAVVAPTLEEAQTSLVKKADEALYRAKGGGRNQARRYASP